MNSLPVVPVAVPLRLTVLARKSYSLTAVILVASTVTALPSSRKPKTSTTLKALIAATAADALMSMLAPVNLTVSMLSPPSTLSLASKSLASKLAKIKVSLSLPPVKLFLPTPAVKVLLPLPPLKMLSIVPPVKVSSRLVPVASSFAANAFASIVTPWTALLRMGEAIFSSLSPVTLTVNAGIPSDPAKSVVSLVISFFSVPVSVPLLELRFRVRTFPFNVNSAL